MNAPINPLALAQQKLAQMRADGIEVKQLNPIEKALADPKSRPKAIRAACYECLGGDECPNIRREIGRCTDYSCGLWPLRPHRKNETEADGTPFGLAKRAAAMATFQPSDAVGIAVLGGERKPKSAVAAIRARCVRCQGNRADVGKCNAVFGVARPNGSRYLGCPLHPVRPYQNGTEDATEDPAIDMEPEVDDEDDI